jgi:hypothetical protein
MAYVHRVGDVHKVRCHERNSQDLVKWNLAICCALCIILPATSTDESSGVY